MADLALQQEERVETFEREESRFEQKWSKLSYTDNAMFPYPSRCDENGVKTFEISRTSWHFGIQTPVIISSGLYSRYIMNGVKSPTKNIETLCHAFLYAVDCDTRNSCILEFTVPGNGTPSYRASAVLHGFRDKTITITWET